MYIPSADIHLSGKILLPPMQKICTYILDFEADINLLVVIKKYAETSIAAEILLPLSIAEMKFFAESFTFHRADITLISDIEMCAESFKGCNNSSATYCKSQNHK